MIWPSMPGQQGTRKTVKHMRMEVVWVVLIVYYLCMWHSAIQVRSSSVNFVLRSVLCSTQRVGPYLCQAAAKRRSGAALLPLPLVLLGTRGHMRLHMHLAMPSCSVKGM